MALLLEPSAPMLPASLTLPTHRRVAQEAVALKVLINITFSSLKKCAA